ncbi:MAG: hypothetical protein ACXVFQ_08180 [Solirubrobacteraceae bacterium]
MDNHHFSYPVVVPLGTMTISGHSTNPSPPLESRQAPRRPQTGVQPAVPALSSPSAAARSTAWR